MPVQTIPVEEACLPRELTDEWERVLGKQYVPEVRERLVDFEGKRLEEMDRFGIEMAVLSLTVARAEFERAVRELGFSGVLVNGPQAITADHSELRYYDHPRYADFWDLAQELGAPVYLHPGLIRRGSPGARDFVGFDWLRDAAWAWGTTTGLHTLRLITSGVFDRHPGAQFVIGHNGEHIVSDLWRIDNRVKRQPVGYPAARPVSSYFATNVHITTSGEFGDNGLRHIVAEIGADRVLFAVDYPYEDNGEGTSWFASAPVSDAERIAIGRENAIRLFNLPLDIK